MKDYWASQYIKGEDDVSYNRYSTTIDIQYDTRLTQSHMNMNRKQTRGR